MSKFNSLITIAGKEFRDVRSNQVLWVMTAFMLSAVGVSLVVAAGALHADVTQYEATRQLLLAMGKSVDALTPPNYHPLSLLRGFIEYIEIIGAVLGIVMGYRSANVERQAHTTGLILSRPVSSQILMSGKLLGNVMALSLSIVAAYALGAFGVQWIGGVHLSADDWLRIAVTMLASIAYVTVFFSLSLVLTAHMRRPANALLLAFGVWMGLVLITPQIGDTLDPDNQVGKGVFQTLGVPQAAQKDIMKSFKRFETVRDSIEQSSPAKHLERLSFAALGIKASYADWSLGAVLRDRTQDIKWLFLLVLGLPGLLITWPIRYSQLKEN